MKITHHDPPIVKEFEITCYRKWWQFWKPKTWVETETHEYEVVYDFEGASTRDGIAEMLKPFERKFNKKRPLMKTEVIFTQPKRRLRYH